MHSPREAAGAGSARRQGFATRLSITRRTNPDTMNLATRATTPWIQRSVIALPMIAGWLAFHGTLRYGFAQDDWMRLEAAAEPLGAQFADLAAAGEPGRRPIEQLYFAGALRLFGPSSTAFHIVALVLHSLDILLVHELLRRLTSASVALLGSTFFAVHMAAFTVVYWTACTPELLTTGLSLTALLALITPAGATAAPTSATPRVHRAPGSAGRSACSLRVQRWWWALPCFAAALAAKETPILVPILVWPLARAAGVPAKVARARTLALAAVSAAYLVFYVVIKKGLADPAYPIDLAPHHIADRAATYLVWAHAFASPIRFVDEVGALSRWLTAAACALQILWLVGHGRGRKRIGLIGLLWVGVVLAPVLLISGHEYRYLLYLALPGVILFWSPLVDAQLDKLANCRAGLVPWVTASATTALILFGTRGAMRTEVAAGDQPGHWNRDHFVIRRALIAEKILAQTEPEVAALGPNSAVLFMGRDGKRNWWDQNLRASLAGGAALRVHYNRSDLAAYFFEQGVPQDVQPAKVVRAALTRHEQVVLYYYEIDGTLTRATSATRDD